jgi:hypothetical protein
MPRFRAYVRQHHLALLALFVALGGTSYAASALPDNSVGNQQIKNNAVTSPKVKNHSLLARDFKPGQLPEGPRGATGKTGPTGPRGPGTFTLDGQFDYSTTVYRTLPLGNNLELVVQCSNIATGTSLTLRPTASGQSFYGWGTSSDGTMLQQADDSTTGELDATSLHSSVSQLDVVAHSTAQGEPVKYTRVDASAIQGQKCNYHVLVTPHD